MLTEEVTDALILNVSKGHVTERGSQRKTLALVQLHDPMSNIFFNPYNGLTLLKSEPTFKTRDKPQLQTS